MSATAPERRSRGGAGLSPSREMLKTLFVFIQVSSMKTRRAARIEGGLRGPVVADLSRRGNALILQDGRGVSLRKLCHEAVQIFQISHLMINDIAMGLRRRGLGLGCVGVR